MRLQNISGKLQSVEITLSKILEVNSHHWDYQLYCWTLLGAIYVRVAHLCHQPIFARCCKVIIGCQQCVDEWYKGDEGISKTCPLCQGDRGCSDTSKILGLDEFLITLAKITGPSQPQSQETDNVM